MLTLLLLLFFLAAAAGLWFQSLWGALIQWVNILLAALLATNVFEPIAAGLASALPDYSHLFDFAALWGVFFFVFFLLRGTTELLTWYRVQFPLPVELAGRSVLALLAAWTLLCFATFSIHLAPLPAAPFGSFQRDPETVQWLGLGPDRCWLDFVQGLSRGSLARGGEVDSPYPEDAGSRVFDPRGEFILKYRHRRATFEAAP